MSEKTVDLDSIRERLSTTRGPEYWRCLEELADTDEFRELLAQEFPRQASAWPENIDRRDFLKFMGASLALGGLSGCVSSAPAPRDEKIVPYVKQPEQIIPGKPLYYASAMPFAGFAQGVIVESHMGRPTKIEGNPQHPGTLGASNDFMQASILTLYDPDRSHALSRAGQISTWNAFYSALNPELENQRLNQGAGLRILTETVTSPTLAYQLQELLRKFPRATWHQYEGAGRDSARQAARLAFGEIVETTYRLDKADVILSLDADFLFFGPANLRYARDFADRRRVMAGASMNRLYAVESTPTVSGSMADHRLALRPSEIESCARDLAKGLNIQSTAAASPASQRYDKWMQAVLRDLQNHRGASLVIAGDQQPPIIHWLAHAMNQTLGNVGTTVIYTEPVEAQPTNQLESLRDLVRAIDANQVQLLLIIGGNPVYTAPADLHLASRLVKSNLNVHLSDRK